MDRELMEAILQCGTGSKVQQQEVPDELENFGKSVAQKMCRLTSRQQASAKDKITELLYETEFGVSE